MLVYVLRTHVSIVNVRAMTGRDATRRIMSETRSSLTVADDE